ncbi:DUF1024 family protein [Staphylococcus pasteuri]|uniref:DUF1024 family protein n=1 Tax=Staphylococcus pasteuri TaxID=45972 RepID=UPI00249A33FE|nr:DUF1024 family protein [Staphylococcus pasteuri]MDI3233329.1 DUF1024 family protein [Staphylococcus pasteuri]
MTNREQIEQAVISAGAFNGNDTDELLSEISKVYKRKSNYEAILNFIVEKISVLKMSQRYTLDTKQIENIEILLKEYKEIEREILILERGSDVES